MHCPFCSHPESKVTDSRNAFEQNAIRRRRECLKCGNRFTTYEYIENVSITIIKNDGKREPFDRNKLLKGITISCNKLPVSTDKIDEIVDDITREIESKGEREISSHEIGEMVMERLKKLHEVAYVRFASVYRKFQDTNEFIKVLNKIHQ